MRSTGNVPTTILTRAQKIFASTWRTAGYPKCRRRSSAPPLCWETAGGPRRHNSIWCKRCTCSRGCQCFPCGLTIESTSCRSEEHTSELQSRLHLVCRLLLEKKKKNIFRSYLTSACVHSCHDAL